MDEPEGGNVIENADVHVCAFPNIDKLLIIDVRNETAPLMRVVTAAEVITPEYYDEVEAAFSKLLRAEGPGFSKIIALPIALRVVLQEKGVAAIQRLFPGPAKEGDVRISIVVADSGLLALSDEDLELATEAFFNGRMADSFVDEYSKAFAGLVAEERKLSMEKERQELRNVVMGDSDQFFTMWDRRSGEGQG